MHKIREWGFPVALIVIWMLAAAYTVSLMIEAPDRATPSQEAPPAASAAASPAS